MDDPHVNLDSRDNTSMPLWVKVFGIIAILFLLVFLLLHLTGNGFRHLHPGHETPASPPPQSVPQP